ncbi:actin cytoskeleton-regulatory complex protein pan1 [Neltuma alba]|uniref:actin cytoskeleton-regulatory complex protein pan1 n=1 Tax=Neltuma alba TaxID=207710 RepID=UPI0010A3D6CE|nr:actin cytoskeleton-regulatory complex protein pan1 [Prosopis alba]
MSGGGIRASIPNNTRKLIQNIKEITGNHSEEEIYAMLTECSMDPDETTQKLLLQDLLNVQGNFIFDSVVSMNAHLLLEKLLSHFDLVVAVHFSRGQKKKDRRKENLNNRESGESRWKPGTQGRGVRGGGGRASFSSHHVSHDAVGSKSSDTGKDNGTNQVTEKSALSLPASQETKNKERGSEANSVPVTANGPTIVASGNTGSVNHSSSSGRSEGTGVSFGGKNSLGSNLPSDTLNKGQVLVPPNDLRSSGAVGAIRHEVGNQRPPGDFYAGNLADNKATAVSETVSSSMQGKIIGKSPGATKNHLSESAPSPTTATNANTSNSRPSSNYSNRSQQLLGSQKAGSNKEWKPKPTNTINQGSVAAGSSEAAPVLAEEAGKLQSAPCVLDSEEASSKLRRKLEDLHLPQPHVILPNHIFVPDSEKTKFSFGSLGTPFGVHTSHVSTPDSEKSSTLLSETSQGVEETTDEQTSSQKAAVTAEDGDYPDHAQSPTNAPENLPSSEVDVSSSAIQEYNESKQDAALPSGGHQHSAAQTSPNYSFGFVPPMLGTQLPPFDNSESQALDISRLPSFVVHQPFDPTSYYAQFYRSGADGDGRLSPFQSAGVSAKYGGNVTVLPAPNSQSPQEGGVLSTAGPTPLVTQAAGLMQSSIAVTQQPVTVFRPPSGVHISHYPPNYIPYGHYFSPFYVPPPAIHQFLGNGAFPPQPQASPVYPPPPAAAAAGMKYPLPPYKPGTNATNPGHIVLPSAYGAYGSSPVGYNPSSTATAGNSNSNEDLGPSQFKESNVYINGQQSEGSAVWVAAPGREMSSLPTSSFYSLPPQGQHVTFAPTQAGHGTFAGIYHPAQAVPATTVHPLLQQSQTIAGAVDMVGPGGSVYQQPQHSQMNWPSNY